MLDIARRNVDRNRHLIQLYSTLLKGDRKDEASRIKVKQLDWRTKDLFVVHTDDDPVVSWTAEDVQDLQRADILLAADGRNKD